jgi:hypothetical protein
MSERSSFSIGPNFENEKGEEAKKLYEAHQNDPNNPQPIADAKKHYEENTEAYHNQAAMDTIAAGKDVNTSSIKHNTSGTVITGEHKGDVVIDTGKHPGVLRVEGAVIEGDFTIK